MSRIDASIHIEGDEPVSFHRAKQAFVMFVGMCPMTFPDEVAARRWFARVNEELVAWDGQADG